MATPARDRTLHIDGHIHVYPGYDWAKAVDCLLNNLPTHHRDYTQSASRDGHVFMGLLAESQSCHFYQEVLHDREAFRRGSLHLLAGPDEGAITIRRNDEVAGYLIAGRQIVTREKLEILGLGADVTVPDGLPADTTLNSIRDQGASPVLSWSPGKWFFKRGKRIRDLIETREPGSFLIGDTGLRPALWPLPFLMRLALKRGFVLVGGSDPLPLPGEEQWCGTYGMQITAEFDPAAPAASLRKLLADTNSRFTLTGKRCATTVFLSRWVRNQVKQK